MEKSACLQWKPKVTSIEVSTRHSVDSSFCVGKLAHSWAMSHLLSKKTVEAIINGCSVRTLVEMLNISQRQTGLVRIYIWEEIEVRTYVSQQQQVTLHRIWHVLWQRGLYVADVCTLHRIAKVVNRCLAIACTMDPQC